MLGHTRGGLDGRGDAVEQEMQEGGEDSRLSGEWQIQRQLDFSMQLVEPEPEPEPSIDTAEVRERIAEIYAVHNPRKLDGDIDVLLEQEWVGEEEALLAVIQEKYLAPSAALHRRLAVARQRLAWGKVCETERLLPTLGTLVARHLLVGNVRAAHAVSLQQGMAAPLPAAQQPQGGQATDRSDTSGDVGGAHDDTAAEPERFQLIPAHSEEHHEWLVKPTAKIMKTEEEEEADWVPPSMEAAIRRHALNRRATIMLAVIASADVLFALCGWFSITQCDDDDGFPTNVFCWWEPPRFSLKSFAGLDTLQYYNFTTSLIDVLVLCWARNTVLLLVVWARHYGRVQGKQVLHLRVSSEDDRLAPLFVDPKRMFEDDAGMLTMTLTVCTVPELEEKIARELGLRRSHSIKVLWTDPTLGFTDELWSLTELPTYIPAPPLKNLLGSKPPIQNESPPDDAARADVSVAIREPGEVLANDRSEGRVAPWGIVWKIAACLVILCLTALVVKVAQRAMYAHSSEWTVALLGLVATSIGGNILVATLLLSLSHLEQRRRNGLRKERILVIVLVLECLGVWLTWTSVTHCKTVTEEGTISSGRFLCWFDGPQINLHWAAPSVPGEAGGASADVAWLATLRFILFAYMSCRSDNDKPIGRRTWRLASALAWITVGATLVEAGAAICEWGAAPPVANAAGSGGGQEEGSWGSEDVAALGARPKSSPWLRFVPRLETCTLIPTGQIILLSGGVLFGTAEAWFAHRRFKTLQQRHKAASRVAPEDVLDMLQGAPPGCWESIKRWTYTQLAGPTTREVVQEGDRLFQQEAYSKACAKYKEAISRSADGLYCAELFNRMGWAALLRGDDDDAMKQFEQAVKYNGLCIHSRYNLATLLLQRKDEESTSSAEMHLRKALAPNAAVTAGGSEKDAENLRAKVSVNLACVLSSQGQVKEAAAMLRQLLQTVPDHQLASTNLALLLLNSSSSAEEIEDGEHQTPPAAQGDDTKGTLGASAELEEACALLRRLCVMYPGSPEVHHCLAAALHRQALAIEPVSEAAHDHTEAVKRKLIDEAITNYTQCAHLQEGYKRRAEGDGRGGKFRAGAYAGQLRVGTLNTGWKLGVWELNEEAAHGRAAVLASLGLAVSARRAPGWKGRSIFCHRTALQLYPDYLVPSMELAELMPPGSAAQEIQLRHVLSLDSQHTQANNLMARAHAKRGERQVASHYYEHAGPESDMAANAKLPSMDQSMLSQLTYRGAGATSGYGVRRPSSAMAERYADASNVARAAALPQELQPPKRPYSARPSMRRVAEQERAAAESATVQSSTQAEARRRKAAKARGEIVEEASLLQKMFAAGVDSRAKLPSGWKPHISESSGRTVFVNQVTGAQQYETPTEAALRPRSATRQPDYTQDGYGGQHPAGYGSDVFVKGRPLSAAATTSVRQSERSAAEMAAVAARPHSAGHLRHEAVDLHNPPASLGFENEHAYKLPRRPLSAELFAHGRKDPVVKATTEERVRQLKAEAGAGFRGRALWARDAHSIGMGSPGPVHSPPPPGAKRQSTSLPEQPEAGAGIVDIYSGSPEHPTPRGASPPGVVRSASGTDRTDRPMSAGSWGGTLTTLSPELSSFTRPRSASPSAGVEQSSGTAVSIGAAAYEPSQRVQQVVSEPGKRQPAASYPSVPDAAGGKIPEEETWAPAHGHRNAFLVRDEVAATASWVNPNNENALPDPVRSQLMAMQMPHEEPALLRNELAQRRARPASAGPVPASTHAHRATPPVVVSRPLSAAARRSTKRSKSTDVFHDSGVGTSSSVSNDGRRPSSASTARSVALGGVSFPVSHVATVSNLMSSAKPTD
eukprot:COSAG02_NODE_420_length_22610_cov_22.488694_8_plen_1833_part_00